MKSLENNLVFHKKSAACLIGLTFYVQPFIVYKSHNDNTM